MVGMSQRFDDDTQYWVDANYQLKLTQNSALRVDGGYRSSFSDSIWSSVYLRPQFRYYLNGRASISGSVAFFITDNPIIENSDEFRLSQQFSYSWPDFGWCFFHQRIRFEERYSYYERESESLQNSWSFRGRYMIRLETKDFTLFNLNELFYLFISIDFFVPLDGGATERFVNRNRFASGFGHTFSEKFKLELQYVRQRSRLFSNDGSRTDENIFRLRMFYYAWTKKSLDF